MLEISVEKYTDAKVHTITTGKNGKIILDKNA